MNERPSRYLSLLLLAFVAFAGVNVLVEIGAGAAALGERPVDLQSPNLYRARLGTFFAGEAPGARRVVFVGDSLIAGRNLQEELGEAWPRSALPAATERASAGRLRVLNLGVEGVLFGDVDCMVQELLRRGADGLVLHLNPRPFAGDFAAPGQQLARPWLCEQTAMTDAARAASEVGDRVPVVAWRDLVQHRLFGGPLRGRLVETVKGLTRPAGAPAADGWEVDPEDAALLADASWRIAAARRYNDIEIAVSHPSHARLTVLLERLADSRVPTVLLYVGEDTVAIAQQLDQPHYERQREAFLALVREATQDAPNLRFLPLSRDELKGLYDDHVHLKAAGYEKVADRVLTALDELFAGRGPSPAD